MDRTGTDTRWRTPLRDRIVAGFGAGLVVVLFGYLLVLGLTVSTRLPIERQIALLDLRPPIAAPHRKPPVEPARLRRAAAASPRNRRNMATALVAPPPLVPPVVRPPIVAAVAAGAGTAPDAGASTLPGPGQGAGGTGSGLGSGGEGDGDGGGYLPPRQIRGRLKFSDIPPDLVASGIGGTVAIRYQVESDGRVSDCAVTASSGSAELDALTCRLIRERFRFDPSRDPAGRPVRAIIVESHSWIVERADEPPQP